MSNDNKFEYTYSAKRQEEIEAIKKKYLPKEDKMEQLRELDRSVERPGTVIGIAFGIIGTLLLGIGMCCTMVWAEKYFVLGIIVGVLGIGLIAAAYPVFKKVTQKRREKLAPQILALSEELLK